jgi:glucose/arabinose dehydrogenase
VKKPDTATGLSVEAWATGLNHPRWLYVLPNGDVLVAESNAPADRPEEGTGIKGFVFRMAQKRAGAGVASADRIVLLRDAGNGQVTKTTFLENLHPPFGMTLVGNVFYVANTDAVVRFAYTEGATHNDEPGEKIADLPAGPINHHWTKNLIASKDGSNGWVKQQCRRERPGQGGKLGLHS